MSDKKHETAKPAVVAEQPKSQPAVEAKPAETKTKATPVGDRRYIYVSSPSIIKGKQRQIVDNIMKNAGKPMTVAEVTELATKAGLSAVGGVGPSCRYHLHHLELEGFVKVENKTTTIAVEKKVNAA